MSIENTMTKQDWEEVDLDSRKIIIALLQRLNKNGELFTEIEESHGNCVYDLSCRLKGYTTAIEIKDRSFESTRYGDVFCEDIKLTVLNRFQRALAVNVFTDGVIALCDMKHPKAKHFKKLCPLTSRVKGASQEMIMKDCLSLPQVLKFKFKRNADGTLTFTNYKTNSK